MRVRLGSAFLLLAVAAAVPATAATPAGLTRLEGCLRGRHVYVSSFSGAQVQYHYRMPIEGGFTFGFPFVLGATRDGGTAVLAHTAAGAVELERDWRRQAVDPGAVAYRRGLLVVVWRSAHASTRRVFDPCLPPA
jgi:hypothetical protein